MSEEPADDNLTDEELPDENDAGATLPSRPTEEARIAASTAAIEIRVEEEQPATRIDSFLSATTGESRAQIRRWIDAGRVRVDGKTVRASRLLQPGDLIEALPIPLVHPELRPEAIDLEIVYEDADLIVVDKPAGLVVHPAPGHPSGTLVNALLHHCGDLAGIGGVLRPGIVHRLDRGTSGVMVAAKHDGAHAGLSEQFANHTIDRIYRTFVRGLPKADEGRIDRPIGRHPKDRKRMSVVTGSGRPSVTNWKVLRRFHDTGISELEIRPETGRTHQIRVHLAASGLPVVGDVVYGKARGSDANLGRPALHALRLGFAHPADGASHCFEVPLPEDLLNLVANLGPAEVAAEPEPLPASAVSMKGSPGRDRSTVEEGGEDG